MKRAAPKKTASGAAVAEITMLAVALVGLLVIVALAIAVAVSAEQDAVGTSENADPTPITAPDRSEGTGAS